MKITAQDFIIISIKDAMDDTLVGQGIRDYCNVNYELKGNGSFIELKRKDGKPMDCRDAFWLGYYSRECI